MTTIYLLRHGQYENHGDVVPYRLPGFHLSEQGKKDVQSLASRFSTVPIKAVFTSPMERTQETAAILAKPHGLIPTMDERLNEVRSPLQGKKPAQIEAIHPYEWSIYDTDWYKNQHGETIGEVYERLFTALTDIRKKYVDQSVIIVTHADPIMFLVTALKGLPLTPEGLDTTPYVSMATGFEMHLDRQGKLLDLRDISHK